MPVPLLAPALGLARPNGDEEEYKDPPDGNTRFFLLPFILLGASFPPSAPSPRLSLPLSVSSSSSSSLLAASGQHLDGPCFKLTFSRANIARFVTPELLLHYLFEHYFFSLRFL